VTCRARIGVASVAFAALLGGAGHGASGAPPVNPRILCTLPPGASHLPPAARRGLIGHLEQYPDVSLATAAQRAAARRILVLVGREARHWTTLAAAKRAGFETRTAPRKTGDVTAHYLHAEKLRERRGGPVFDPRRPKALIFARQPGEPAVLVGVMYSVQRGESGRSPGGAITRWHSHVVCASGNKRGRKPQEDGRCPPGTKAFQGSEMMHVWFTRDLRSAFAVGAPEPELCRDHLLSGAFCRSPGARRAM
jgi:hypothetical protein